METTPETAYTAIISGQNLQRSRQRRSLRGIIPLPDPEAPLRVSGFCYVKVFSQYTIEIHIREVVLSLVGKYFVSFGPPSVMMYILSAFCMLWTYPRSIMDPPEVPNLKVFYQREYISIIRGNIISMIGRLLLFRCTILSGKKKAFLS